MLNQMKKITFILSIMSFSSVVLANQAMSSFQTTALPKDASQIAVQVLNRTPVNIQTDSEKMQSIILPRSRSSLAKVNLPLHVKYHAMNNQNRGCEFDISVLGPRVVVDSYQLNNSDSCQGYINEDQILVLTVDGYYEI